MKAHLGVCSDMAMKKTVIALVVMLVLGASYATVLAADTSGGARLDEHAVRANLSQWMAKQENASPGAMESRIVIERVVPVQGGPLPLFAVRLLLHPPQGVEGAPKSGVMVFDASGTYRFSGLNELATGADLIHAARTEAMRYALPADFGRKLADFGGTHEVVLVSDPFCPHCRKLWVELKKYRPRIGVMRLVHLPLVGREGSEALGWGVDHAIAKGMDAVAVAEYIMGGIEQPGGGLFQGMDAAVGALEVLFEKYPEFRQQLGAPEAAWELLRAQYGPVDGKDRQRCWRMGLGAVPAVFVDGVLVRGYNPARLRQLLGG